MSTSQKILPPINPVFVPEEVTNGYLKNYSEDVLKQIEKLSKRFEEAEFKKTENLRSSTPIFTLVAGTTGVGKSRIVDPMAKASVVCDAFDLLKQIPAFHEAWVAGHLSEDSNNGTIHATRSFHPGAKWIADRAMTNGLLSGRNVTLETEAQASGIGNLLKNIAATGITIDSHICQAPFSVKLQGAYAQSRKYEDTVVDEEKMRETNKRMIQNMPVIAEKTNGVLTIHFRDNVAKPLEVVAITVSPDAFHFNSVLAARFEREFGNGMIGQLMGDRKGMILETKAAAQQTGPQPVLVM